MSQINLDDSDCIIQDTDITCITLDDSFDGETDDACKEIPLPPPILPQITDQEDVEEGEVSEDDNVDLENETICEIKFPAKNQFEKFGTLIINNIKDCLTAADKECARSLKITTSQDQECVAFVIEQIVQTPIKDIPIPACLTPITPDDSKIIIKTFEKEQSPDLSGLSELFMIDTEPAAKIDSVKVPSYKRTIKDTLLDGEAAANKRLKEEEAALKTKKSNTCFNCGEADHSIRECPKPHNAKRIKNAKRACFKVERYHVDVEQRFANIKPGNISEKLRDALGLRKGELPFFFYRMRVLGYPPGWLQEAKVEHSGITLFNSDGSKILHSDEDEGEVDPLDHKYNVSKIHDFPGFNQNPGENFFDDYKYHNVPPLNKNQMKDEFIKTLGDNILKSYKRKKLKNFPNASAEDSTIESPMQEATDMEIEDPEATAVGEVQFTRPPPPADQPPPTPPPPTSPPTCESPLNVDSSQQRDLSMQSPSLLELEKQKQALLQELQANTSIIEIEDSLIDEIIELDEFANNEDEDKSAGQDLIETNNKNSDNSSEATAVNHNSDANVKATVIKESFMGTPVELKFSPYDNLPNGDNFKVGVSDVINFENLPDSTGKYEQMKEVIKKVRNCIHKLHYED